MNQSFLITEIKRVILVDRDEFQEPVTTFRNHLTSHELIFHFSGEATVQFNGKTLETKGNTIRFLPKGETSEYIVHRKARGVCIDVFFDTDHPVSHEAFVLKCSRSDIIGNLFKKLFSVWVSRTDGYYYECLSILYKIFAELQKQDYTPEKQRRAIEPAIAYLEEHFLERKISVQDLAARCNISPSYLKQLFIKRFGLPPSKYMISLKVNYARDLLQSGLYTIAQTAERCGYNDVYFFSRQFKEYTGLPPSAVRQTYKSSK